MAGLPSLFQALILLSTLLTAQGRQWGFSSKSTHRPSFRDNLDGPQVDLHQNATEFDAQVVENLHRQLGELNYSVLESLIEIGLERKQLERHGLFWRIWRTVTGGRRWFTDKPKFLTLQLLKEATKKIAKLEEECQIKRNELVQTQEALKKASTNVASLTTDLVIAEEENAKLTTMLGLVKIGEINVMYQSRVLQARS